MKKIRLIILAIILAFILFIPNVYAGNLDISASTKTITNGQTVNITVKVSGLAGKFKISSSNGNILAGGDNGIWIENQSKTFKFTAKGVGTATVTVTPINVGDLDDNSKYTASKSVTINVVKPREKSTNNNLKSLSVEGYSLSPTFDKNILEYTVNLESNVEKIKINASKEDYYASVNGIGEKEVQEGDNKFQITVTSETGKTKTYTVNAIVKDSNPIIKVIDGKKYTIVKRGSALEKPDLFEETVVTIQEIEIPAFYNNITKITLVGLKDEEGIIYLYQYDRETDTYQKYDFLTSQSKTIILESSKEKIDGYRKKLVTIDGKEYTVYQSELDSNYFLIYGIDIVTGNRDWYLYHIKEQTLQRYMSDIIGNMKRDFSQNIQQYKIALFGMAGLVLFLLMIIIIQITSKSKLRKKFLKKIQQLKEENNKSTELEKKKLNTKNKLEVMNRKNKEHESATKKTSQEDKIVKKEKDLPEA